MNVRERFLDTLRATLGAEKGAASAGGAVEEALLFRAYERATAAMQSAVSTCQTAGAKAAQQRAALDAATDHVRLLLARSRDIRGTAQQLREAIERTKLVALNAGLEGARIGEPVGKPLVTVADEVRNLATRALEALDEHLALISQVDKDRDKLRDQVDVAREAASAVAEELLRAQSTQREATGALSEFGQGLQRATGADPETARAVAEAADHARGLLGALSTLATRPQRRFVLRALRPSLRPLMRLLRDLYRGSEGSDGR
jgi:methyl-accepting chemotaxis protein